MVQSNVPHITVRIQQFPHGILNPQIHQVCAVSCLSIFPEHMGEIGGCKAKPGRNHFQAQLLIIVLLHILRNLGQLIQMPFLLHPDLINLLNSEFCHNQIEELHKLALYLQAIAEFPFLIRPVHGRDQGYQPGLLALILIREGDTGLIAHISLKGFHWDLQDNGNIGVRAFNGMDFIGIHYDKIIGLQCVLPGINKKIQCSLQHKEQLH